MRLFILLALVVFTSFNAEAQTTPLDSLKEEILALSVSISEIDLRMEESQKQFQSGIIVSTIGYSVTIAGGLMLGRERDGLGQAMLVVGGVTGALGTYILVDSFRVLAGRKNKKLP